MKDTSRPRSAIPVHWPNGRLTEEPAGRDWLVAAREAGVLIPTGCLGGSCGACEIEVNGRIVRACVARVPAIQQGSLTVGLAEDPFW
ncbi:MAG: 2Fe-2S iron-sulfur cluster binding domain-containing protein [Synechococcaceae cyanobacterium]